MKKLFCIIAPLVAVANAHTQYYYNDLINLKETNQLLQLLLKNKVKQVEVSAFEPDGSAVTDFVLRQQINQSAGTMLTFSKSSFSDASILLTRYNAQGVVLEVVDSSDGGTTKTTYQYTGGLLTELTSSAQQEAQAKNQQHETRTYTYNEKGQPAGMVKITNGKESLRVTFVAEANGQIGTEVWYKGTEKVETWYYYYDDQGNMTDIVRFNKKAQQMLPDYLFGYNEEGKLTSKVAVQPVTGSFRIWQYAYNAQGLKATESILNKSRKPEGRLEYNYQ
ncbi:MAG: hypothetical protein MUF24_10360 [Chitinophagaceae bacterium]|nr:hypothetical protein [Chitinophagaceae bacterium]